MVLNFPSWIELMAFGPSAYITEIAFLLHRLLTSGNSLLRGESKDLKIRGVLFFYPVTNLTGPLTSSGNLSSDLYIDLQRGL